jgi:hypothetical protein
LAEVLEARLGLRHAVTQLVADYVERPCHHAEDVAVAVAEVHPLTVPECVRILVAEVDDSAERHARIVDRVAAVCLEPEVEGVAEAVVGLVGGLVPGRRLAFAAHDRAAHVLGPLGVADDAGRPRRRHAHERVRSFRRRRRPDERVLDSREADRAVAAQSARGPFTLLLVALARDVLENDRRQHAVKAVPAAVHCEPPDRGGERVVTTLRP